MFGGPTSQYTSQNQLQNLLECWQVPFYWFGSSCLGVILPFLGLSNSRAVTQESYGSNPSLSLFPLLTATDFVFWLSMK